MFIKHNFTSEAELKKNLDYIYNQSQRGKSFNGILEVAFNEVTIITAIHNIKSNKGANTAGIDGAKMDKYLQMEKNELIKLIRKELPPKTSKKTLHQEKQWENEAIRYSNNHG